MVVAKLILLAGMMLVFVPSAGGGSFPFDIPGFTLAGTGPDGGTVWQGRIPNREVHDPRLSDVYLPPDYSPMESYRVVYFLHGFLGSEGSVITGMPLADIADEQLA